MLERVYSNTMQDVVRYIVEHQGKSGFNLFALPKDIQGTILSLLDLKDLRLSRVSREFNNLFIKDSYGLTQFWRNILRTQMPDMMEAFCKNVKRTVNVETQTVDWVKPYLAWESLQYPSHDLRLMAYQAKRGFCFWDAGRHNLLPGLCNPGSLTSWIPAIKNQIFHDLLYGLINPALHDPGSYSGNQGTLLHCAILFNQSINIIILLLDGHWGIETTFPVCNSRPLMLAAAHNRKEIVMTLIDRGAHIDAQNAEGRTALMLAAGAGHVEIVDILLKASASVNKVDHHHASALFMAAQHGHLNVVLRLLQHHAKTDVMISRDLYQLQQFVQAYPCEIEKRMQAFIASYPKNNGTIFCVRADQIARIMGHDVIAELIIDEQAKRDALNWLQLLKATPENKSPLIAAVFANDIVAVARLLATNGVDVNATDELAMSALMYACLKGFFDIVKLLVVDVRTKIFCTNVFGHTSYDITVKAGRGQAILHYLHHCAEYRLFHAIKVGNESYVENYIIRQSNRCNKSQECFHPDTGVVPLKAAIMYSQKQIMLMLGGLSYLADAIIAGNLGQVNEFIAAFKHDTALFTDVTIESSGCFTPESRTSLLCLAITRNQIEIFMAFASIEGIDLNSTDHGMTLLMLAVIKERVAIVNELLLREEVDVNICDHFGNSAFMLAAKYNLTDIMQLMLLDGRVHWDQRNYKGKNALAYMLRHNGVFRFVQNKSKEENENNYHLHLE